MSRPTHRRPWLGPKSWKKNFLKPNQIRAVAAALEAAEGRGDKALLRKRRGAILADEVGMGKTWEALGTALLFISRNGGKAVFFVPPALVQKWHEEIEEFCRRVLASAPPRAVKRAAIKLKRESHEIVKSTSRLKRFSRGTTLLAKKCRLLVLDEAHKARKEGTVLHRCLKRFIRRKRNKLRLLLLTATPFQCDHRRELVNLLQLVDSGYQEEESHEAKTGIGYSSITSGVRDLLEKMFAETEAMRKQGIFEEGCIRRMLRKLDLNLDLDSDPQARTFGVAREHDGFDEFLRALVIRTPKPRVKTKVQNVGPKAADYAHYLFGRSYLKAQPKGRSEEDDPPPGSGFLPNGYSRLCSTHSALAPKGPKGKPGGHAHGKMLLRRAQEEGKPSKEYTHPKLDLLIERLRSRPKGRFEKTVVFVNHLKTVSQLRKVLMKEACKLPITFKTPSPKDKPRVSDLKNASKLMASSGLKKSCERASFLSEDHQNVLARVVERNLARWGSSERPVQGDYLKSILDGVDDALGCSGVRRYLRRELSGMRQGRGRLRANLPIKGFKPVEFLTGETEMLRRQRLLRAFNRDKIHPQILIVSQAGSEGQNMHEACRRVIHYDLHWNPTVLHQRTGRVHRDKIHARDVQAEELVYTGGYDEKIREEAMRRDVYRDFLLGEKTLRQLLESFPESDRERQIKTGRGFRIDLRPAQVSFR